MLSVMLYPCMICVALSIDMSVLCVACLTVFVNCFVKQLAICLGVDVILLLIVMEFFSVVGGALSSRPFMVFQIGVYCACDPSVRPDVFSIFFLYICVCRKLSPYLRA